LIGGRWSGSLGSNPSVPDSGSSAHTRRGAAEFLSLRFVRIAPLFYFFCAVQAGNLLLADVAIGFSSTLDSIFFLPLFDKDQYS
jgi:hypothetical protein